MIVKKLHISLAIRSVLVGLLILAGTSAYAQADKKYIRKGNRQYEKSNYSESEVLYRKAGDENAGSPAATFNIGDALYKQSKFDDAGKQFIDHGAQVEDPVMKAASMYNLGNSLLQSNKVKESIEAYKNALKLNPGNLEAKYNLGYAQNLLKQQEQQQQQQQQQQQNKDDQQNQQNQQDNQEQQKNEDQQDQQNQSDQQKQQEQQQQQEQQGISKEDAERLLNALANDEKNVQEKVKREKAAKSRSRALKNW